MPDTFEGLQIPPIDQSIKQPHTALAEFLEAAGFTVHDGTGATNLIYGRNLFTDFYPDWYFSDDPAEQADPGATVIVLFYEPLVGTEPVNSYNQKHGCVVRIEVNHGYRDVVLLDATRLYQFFLRRENAIQFVSCGISVRHVRPYEMPSLVGEDESNRAVYSFRLVMKFTLDTSPEMPEA